MIKLKSELAEKNELTLEDFLLLNQEHIKKVEVKTIGEGQISLIFFTKNGFNVQTTFAGPLQANTFLNKFTKIFGVHTKENGGFSVFVKKRKKTTQQTRRGQKKQSKKTAVNAEKTEA